MSAVPDQPPMNQPQPDGRTDYGASSIQILEGLEAVRKRPGMYIGDTHDGTGLHHMVFEVVDNSVDEALAGHCDDIIVTIHTDNSISVVDNGRGIPTDVKFDDKHNPRRSAAEIALTELHAGGKFDQNSYKVSGGLHGVGVSCVNALSEWLRLTIRRGGNMHYLEFRRGDVQDPIVQTVQTDQGSVEASPMKITGPTDRRGTEVHFLPDETIFTNIDFHYDVLSKRLRELSFLNNGVHIKLIDQRIAKEEDYAFSGGVKGFVQYINKSKTVLHPNVLRQHRIERGRYAGRRRSRHAVERSATTAARVYQQYSAAGRRHAHYRATRGDDACAEQLHQESRVRQEGESRNDRRRYARRLACVLSVKVPEPKFSSQTKDKLVSSEVRPAVEDAIGRALESYLLERPADAKIICGKIVDARARGKRRARRAR